MESPASVPTITSSEFVPLSAFPLLLSFGEHDGGVGYGVGEVDLTVIPTVAIFLLVPLKSVTLYVNESIPKKPLLGV